MGRCARTPLSSNTLFSHLHCPVGHKACVHPENIYTKVSAVEKTLATNGCEAPNSTSDCCHLVQGTEISRVPSRGCIVHVCGAWQNSRCLFPMDMDTNFPPAWAEALRHGTHTRRARRAARSCSALSGTAQPEHVDLIRSRLIP